MPQKKQDTSRCKKAFTTSALVYCAVNAGANIQFVRSKMSHCSLKVLRGEEVVWVESFRKDSNDDFVRASDIFSDKMSVLVEDARSKKVTSLVVTKERIHQIALSQCVDHTEKWKDLDYNQDCRNKEACFVNYLALNLVQRGYSLITNVTRIKPSKKTAHFFIWNKIITPENVVINVAESQLLSSFIKHIESTLVRSRSAWVQSNTLPGDFSEHLTLSEKSLSAEPQVDEDSLSVQTPSAFKPIESSQYFVFQNTSVDTLSHPFLHQTFA
ncbi:hypothetical protein EIN_185010 [Entamoeba invadens IP1]|uniref:hypothetical protein n=1 Tax=Entamoeba invadens IP1 TaxID=370355 RepID=UPI0002C3CFAC|nr:hypothetical protein EIN_185010 [Entamoeba invadens IP1]ELP94124.1 hypothetical protein EIN_185010 [Entamoeba invadens IP1]|eukprot:XP_004260895.1 hypothetical protein EIN_185010 [Entamoeba invadens IP1]